MEEKKPYYYGSKLLDEDAKDAERYRWIKNIVDSWPDGPVVRFDFDFTMTGPSLDEAIDAEIAKEKT